jgi:cytoskeleton protein RodZ
MMPSNITQENSDSLRSMGPGDRLQAERIKLGLSIEDVATRMHLSIGILEAIEENNFDDITAPIFVKGYLRAYARIVSLNEDEMIQQYLDYYSDEDPPINSTSNLAPEISSDDARIKWTTFLVIIGLLGLLAVWWWNQYQVKTDVVSLDTEQTDSMQQPEVTSDKVVSEIEPAPSTVLSAAEEVDVSPMPVDEPEVTDLTVVANTQEVVNLEQEEQEIIEVVQQQVEVTELEGFAEEISRMAPMGSDQFEILIHADTWVNIKDASGHRLVYELLRAEQKLILTGKAPFEIFLGNGHGVELIYNNETIDISSSIRDNNTARLKIGNS